MLIVANLRLSALLHWALYYLQLPPGLVDAKAEAVAKDAASIYRNLDKLVTTIITSLGAFHSLLLAGIYIPAAFVLNRRATELHAQPVKQARPQPAGAHNALQLNETQDDPQLVEAPGAPRPTAPKQAIPLSEHLLKLAALLGPLLAGPIGELLGRLK